MIIRFDYKEKELIKSISFTETKERFTERINEYFDDFLVYRQKTIKKAAIIALIGILFLIVGFMFPANNTFFQIIAIIGLIITIFAAPYALINYIFRNAPRKNFLKFIQNSDFSQAFEYGFYKEGILINEPYQKSVLFWSDIIEIRVEPKYVVISPDYKLNTNRKGSQELQQIIIPYKYFEDPVLQEFLNKLHQSKVIRNFTNYIKK